jgi:hypothetical protein
MKNYGRRAEAIPIASKTKSGIGFLAFAFLALPAAAQSMQTEQVSRAAPAPVRDIQVGSSIPSSLDPGEPFEEYRLHLGAGDSVLIDMESPTRGSSQSGSASGAQEAASRRFDTVVELRREGVQDPVAVDDDGGENNNSRLIFTAPSAGDYFIRARAFARGEGDYVLTVTPLPRAPSPTVLAGGRAEGDLDANSPIIGILDETRRYALYWVDAMEGDRMRLHVFSSTPGVTLELLDTSGSTLAASINGGQDAQIISVIPETERYLLRVAIPSSQAAHFTVDLESVPKRDRGPRTFVQVGHDAGDALTLASNISLKADGSGEADFFYQLYFLAVRKDHPVTVIVDSSEFDPVVEAGEVDTLGFVGSVSVNSVAGRTARLVLQPFRNGDVYIRVRSTGLAIGAFRIQIVPGISRPPT